MRIPYFIIIVILCLVLMHIIRRTKRQGEQESARFWERESAADNVRRQDISNLDYIHIPMERLPFGIDSSPEALAAEEQIRELSATQILNLNQYTNTDLKLKYGPANLAFLSECDERFTLLVRTLYQWACRLLDHGYPEAAIQTAEYCVNIGADISGCYYMLTDYYQSRHDIEALNRLKHTAEALEGIQADIIMKYINKSLA